MKKSKIIATSMACLLLLASCGGDSSSSSTYSTSSSESSSSTSSQSSSTSSTAGNSTYTLSEAVTFVVVADYSGSKISFPTAKPLSGDYPAITDTSIFLRGTNKTVKCGDAVTYKGSMTYSNGTYKSGTTNYASACNGGEFSYDAASKKLVFCGEKDGDLAPFWAFEQFANIANYKYVVAADGSFKSVSELVDQEKVVVRAPFAWFNDYRNKGSFTFDSQFAGLYASEE